jgi:hypothetical protein
VAPAGGISVIIAHPLILRGTSAAFTVARRAAPAQGRTSRLVRTLAGSVRAGRSVAALCVRNPGDRLRRPLADHCGAASRSASRQAACTGTGWLMTTAVVQWPEKANGRHVIAAYILIQTEVGQAATVAAALRGLAGRLGDGDPGRALRRHRPGPGAGHRRAGQAGHRPGPGSRRREPDDELPGGSPVRNRSPWSTTPPSTTSARAAPRRSAPAGGAVRCSHRQDGRNHGLAAARGGGRRRARAGDVPAITGHTKRPVPGRPERGDLSGRCLDWTPAGTHALGGAARAILKSREITLRETDASFLPVRARLGTLPACGGSGRGRGSGQARAQGEAVARGAPGEQHPGDAGRCRGGGREQGEFSRDGGQFGREQREAEPVGADRAVPGDRRGGGGAAWWAASG